MFRFGLSLWIVCVGLAFRTCATQFHVLDGCAVINGWSACDWKYSTSPKWVDIVYNNCGSTSTEDFVPNPCEVGVIIQAGFYPDSAIEKLTPGCEIKYKFLSHDKRYYLEYVESERTVCLVGNRKENVRPGDADIWGDDFYYIAGGAEKGCCNTHTKFIQSHSAVQNPYNIYNYVGRTPEGYTAPRPESDAGGNENELVASDNGVGNNEVRPYGMEDYDEWQGNGLNDLQQMHDDNQFVAEDPDLSSNLEAVII